jgi:beta-lactamase regulating signal transducer with metallopeptidase domain
LTVAAILLDSAFKGVLILALCGGAAVVLRRASAAARHQVWSLAVVGLCLLPALGATVPAWRAPVLPWSTGAAPKPVPAGDSAPLVQFQARIDPARFGPGHVDPPTAGVATAPTGIVIIWGLGFLIAATRLLLRLTAAGVRNVRASAITDGAWVALLAEITRQYAIRRPVSLRVDAASAIPATWGLRRPVVLLPVDALDWPRERMRAVLLHELAHVARGDFLVQTLAGVACALHWFNPLAWLAERRLREECELASDDRVLGAGLRPADYATHLVEVLQSARGSREAPRAALAMGLRNRFEDRVRALLDGGRPRGPLAPRRRALMALAAAGLILPLAFVRIEARAHDAPKLERLPGGMTIEVLGISTHPSKGATWWGPDGKPLDRPPCDPLDGAVTLPAGPHTEIVVRITGLPEGESLRWHPTSSQSQGTSPPRKDGKPAPGLERCVAQFTPGLAACELHFDITLGPWETERVFDGKHGGGITKGDRAFFIGKAHETRQGTTLTLAHNIADRVVRVVAIDHDGREHQPTSDHQGGAGHFSGLDVEFDLPPAQIREFRLQSRKVGRFEIKNVALSPDEPRC